MTFAEHFLITSKFLQDHLFLHKKEALHRYSSSLPKSYAEWVEEMKNWSSEEITSFESNLDFSFIKNKAFSAFTQQIKSLISIPSILLEKSSLPPNVKRGLTPKKVHEIEFISSIHKHQFNTSDIIDIGGGKGHLSAALTHNTPCQAISIDRNEQLQIQGKKRLEKWLPDTLSKVQFLHQEVSISDPIPTENISTKTALIGLHSCGNLSSEVIQQGINGKLDYILNFGCCYHHLNEAYNLSEASKGHPIWFSHEALHLAAHAHRTLSISALQKRIQIKRFRYALHFYLNDHHIGGFQKVGDGKAADYMGSFGAYAKKFAPTTLSSTLESELNHYFQQKETQAWIQRIMLMDSIRNILGRVIELYIVLDRCLLLEENGYEVSLSTYFDRKTSPRNLGILGKLT